MTELVTINPAIDQRLENIFRQLLDLYERHAQERQLMIKEKEELVRLVQLLVAQTKEIGQYEQGIRKRIQSCIKEACDAAMQTVENDMTNKGNRSIVQLNEAVAGYCKTIETVVQSSQDKLIFFGWKIITIAVISGVFVGVSLTWLFRFT